MYTTSEVESLCRVWYAPKASQTQREQAELYGYPQPAVDRFRARGEEERKEFRGWLKAFVNLYSFLSQIMLFQDPDLERRHTFLRLLQLKLPSVHASAPPPFDEEVSLKYYRLQQISQGDIQLASGEPAPLKAPLDIGTRAVKDETASLSEIIDILNERFGTEFTQADQLFLDAVQAETEANEQVVQHAQANDRDNFHIVVRKVIENSFLDRVDKDGRIAAKCLSEKDFGDLVLRSIADRVYDSIRKVG